MNAQNNLVNMRENSPLLLNLKFGNIMKIKLFVYMLDDGPLR